MKKLWQIIRYEYIRHVMRKGFIIGLLSVPLWILITVGIGYLLVRLETDNSPVGYVDLSGSLNLPVASGGENDEVELIAFHSVEQVESAFNQGELQFYYIVAEDFLETRNVQLVYRKNPGEAGQESFEAYVMRNILQGRPPAVVDRIVTGPDVVFRPLSDDAEAKGITAALKLMVPFASGIALMMVVLTTSGYLMNAVVDEKENRTMEIMVTSVSPTQIMTGKVIALISAGLSQILVWLGFAIPGVLLFGLFTGLSGLNLNFGDWWLYILMMVPAFFLVSAIMAAIGASVAEAREGQQVSGLVTLPMMIPMMLFGMFLNTPNSPLAVFLSLFPLTAPMAMILRSSLTEVPVWQIVVSASLLILSTIFAMWFAGRVFRLGMLRYGQRVRLAEVFNFKKLKARNKQGAQV